MAYLKAIPKPRCQQCWKVAREILVNRFNAEMGYYCAPHANQALAKQVQAEREYSDKLRGEG